MQTSSIFLYNFRHTEIFRMQHSQKMTLPKPMINHGSLKYLIIIIQIILLDERAFTQPRFTISKEQDEIDFISDVTYIDNNYYFIQNRLENIGPDFDSDAYSDVLITSNDGSILDLVNLNGYRSLYHRILKVESGEIILLGSLKSDSCQSKLVISKFNIFNHTLEHLSFYNFCESIIQNIDYVTGLNGDTFIEGYSYVNGGFPKFILKIDSSYNLVPLFDNLSSTVMLSIDFARTGYVIASCGLYNFYDSEFNYRKQRYTTEPLVASNQTHFPFGQHLILQQTLKSHAFPDGGAQIRLVDSNLTVVKKVVIHPDNSPSGLMVLPYYGGISVKNDNEIWASSMFRFEPNIDSSFFTITKLDSNLNIQCQHFLGYDTWYRIFGIKALESGGAIVYGNKVREGFGQNQGEDIFAIRVGQNCELPTVSTNGPDHPMISISAYPNPGINELSFTIEGFDPATLRVELIDVSGKVLFTAHDLSNRVEVANMPAGQYFYRILQENRLLGVGAWVKL